MRLTQSGALRAGRGEAAALRAGRGEVAPLPAGPRSGGSVLVLVPAGLLVLILLSALAVDSAAAYLGQRQLHDGIAAAANDAAGAGLDDRGFYGQGRISLSSGRTVAAVCTSLAAQHFSDLHGLRLWMSTSGNSVHLDARARVDMVFGRALPGFGSRAVSADVTAVLAGGPIRRGGGSPAPPSALAALSCP